MQMKSPEEYCACSATYKRQCAATYDTARRRPILRLAAHDSALRGGGAACVLLVFGNPDHLVI